MEDFLDRFAQTNAAGEKEFSVVREGLVVGLLSIGTLFGAIVGRYFSDYLGRRKAIAIFCGMFSVGVLIQGEYTLGKGGVSSGRGDRSSRSVWSDQKAHLISQYLVLSTFLGRAFAPSPLGLYIGSHRLHLLGPDHDGQVHLRMGRRRPVRGGPGVPGRVGSETGQGGLYEYLSVGHHFG
jgi:hypothetical protein